MNKEKIFKIETKEIKIDHLSRIKRIRLLFIVIWDEYKYLRLLSYPQYKDQEDYIYISQMLFIRRKEKGEIIKAIFKK